MSEIDDARIEWLRDRVYLALNIEEVEVFDELLSRDDGVYERNLQTYLNETTDETNPSILFYKVIRDREEEYEVEIGESQMQTVIMTKYSKLDESFW